MALTISTENRDRLARMVASTSFPPLTNQDLDDALAMYAISDRNGVAPIPGVEIPAVNFLPDPGFESGVPQYQDTWYAGVGIPEIVDTDAYSGERALKITPTTSGAYYEIMFWPPTPNSGNMQFPIEPSTDYEFSFWSKGTLPSDTIKFYVALEEYEADMPPYLVSNSVDGVVWYGAFRAVTTLTDQWTKYRFGFTTSEAGRFMTITLGAYQPLNTNPWFVDDIFVGIPAVVQASPWIETYDWNGAAAECWGWKEGKASDSVNFNADGRQGSLSDIAEHCRKKKEEYLYRRATGNISTGVGVS